MKISLNWARHWTGVPAYTPEALEKFSHTYSTYTAEVEGIDSYLYDDKIVVGKVLAWKPHPDSDKLGLVQVDAGKCGQHEIVCGAPNAQTSKYVAVALENAELPGGLIITRREIRGIDSCGMICSLDELGLQSDRAEGIFPLETAWDEDTLEKHLGKPFGELTLTLPSHDGDIEYMMNDVVFDLDNKFITNRPDLFSVVGNAREIACMYKTPFLKGDGNPDGKKGDLGDNKSSSLDKFGHLLQEGGLDITVESEKVINYLLTEYTLPDLPASPFLIQTLLRRSNQGSHGLLPDLTNIVMTELGQPMHVFDADTIAGDIVLRMAKKGEVFLGLDDREYTLTPDDLVIVDDKNILALAGIMGGKSSGTTESTRRIFVESASFDAVTVRKTSQRLGIRTDSSIRFEKGVDRTLPHIAQTRYAQLLIHFISGTKQEKQTAITSPRTATIITLSQELLVAKIGQSVPEKDVTDILTRLGFTVEVVQNNSVNSGNAINSVNFVVTVPSWRDTGDISIPEDIIEEIARHFGYENIPGEPLPGPLATARVHGHDVMTQSITRFFSEKGYRDAYTYPFTLAERFARFSDKTPAVIQNTSENRTHLRAHLAENLLELVANSYRTHTDGAFFEFGPIFDGDESLQGVGIVWGKDLEALQADLTSYMMTYFGSPGMIAQGTSDTKLFAPQAYGEIVDESGDIALRFGLVRPTLLPLFDIDEIDVYAFEIVKMPELRRAMKFTPIVEFPGTRREFNIIMPESTPVAVVTAIVRGAHEWISDIGVSEIYRDESHIGADKKSVVVSFLIRDNTATITDEQAAKVQETAISKLSESGYQLRGSE